MPFLIKLPEAETPFPFQPKCTHARLVNFTYEAARGADKKAGYLDVWLAKGFIFEDAFREAPGVPGLHAQVPAESFASLNFELIEKDILHLLLNLSLVNGAVEQG